MSRTNVYGLKDAGTIEILLQIELIYCYVYFSSIACLFGSSLKYIDSELYGREYDQWKVPYNDIYFQQKSLWPIFFPFSPRICQKLTPEVDRTGADLILISVTKWEETSVNKCHGHNLLIIFIIYLLFIFDLHIFLYTDSHSLMMLWRTFEETTNRVRAVLAFRLSIFSYYTSDWMCINST